MNELAKRCRENSFVCSNIWLDRLKKQNNISCGKLVGEAENVCVLDVEKKKAQMCPDVIQDYEEKNACNADKVGLFHKIVSNQSLNFKGEKSTKGKLSKMGIVVFYAQI